MTNDRTRSSRAAWLAVALAAVGCAGSREARQATPAAVATQAAIDEAWDFGDPAASEARFRALLAQPSTAGDGSRRLELETQVARALGLQRRFTEGHQLLDGVEPQLAAADPVARVRYLLERGRLFNSAGERERAAPLFERAWRLGSDAVSDTLAVDAAHMRAIVGTPVEADDWNLRAVDLANRSPDARARRWLASLYNNLGWSAFEAGEYARALEWFERALEEREARGDAAKVRIARWSIAKTLRLLGRVDEALAAQERLLAEHEAAGSTDGYVLEELGECHLARGDEARARPYFARAWRELSDDPWLAESEPARLLRLRQLGGGAD